jgi:DNA-binding PadR family transcriptional regulator
LARKEGNRSQEQIKIRVLAYLYNKQIGVNSYVIQHKIKIGKQDNNRFRGFLEDLCSKSCLEKDEEETRGEKPRIIYKITQKGRTVVEQYRNSLIKDILWNIEDLFTPEGTNGEI